MANNPPYSSIQPLQPPPPVGSMDHPRNFAPPMPVQFRPVVPGQQSQQFIPMAAPHFQTVGRGVPMMNAGLPAQPPQPQFPQSVQQLPARPGQPGPGPPPSQVIALPNAQPSRHVAPGSSLPPPSVPTPINYVPGLGGPGAPVPLSTSYTFAPTSYGQPPVTFNAVSQYQPMAQMHAPNIPAGGQPAISSANQSTAPVAPVQHNGEQSSVTTANVPTTGIQPSKPTEEIATDWKEHVSANGRRYYYNKRTRQSSWEKPFELMTPIERADASTDWKEFTSPDGRKYYFNKVTRQSKWEIPEELKLARERAEKASIVETQTENSANSHNQAAVPPSVEKTPSGADALAFPAQGTPSSPVLVTPVATVGNLQSESASESSALPVISSSVTSNPDGVQTTENPVSAVSGSSEVTAAGIGVDTTTAPINFSGQDNYSSANKAPAQDKEEAAKDVTSEKVNNISLEEKAVSQESLTFADKVEAKNAFKALLESANVGSDWTWDQAMRMIINDRRYGALKTLGERKQAFNEYLGQKRKQEAEERRSKQKKAREDFKNMLEESRELSSTTRWSKAVTMFENDERFKAVERERDRRDLFDAHLQELEGNERAKIQEERKRNIMEYRQFLESCDFIKASTQWRKVQDRLEADERCSRLEKIDRLDIFQDYLRDLEKEEEEQRKIQKEELRKTERKNRDEFRKLLEEHVAAGSLTAKTHWRDYYLKVKDLPAYLAVASNTSGSTPKDLFEDVAEELEKQYHEDKTRIKNVVKLKKVVLPSTWTLEDFKAAIVEDVSPPPISDVNLKIVFDELLERAKEKEEKEAKKRKRLADEFLNLLHSIKEITASSKWETCKELFEGSREFSSINEEGICEEIFEEYIAQLKEQAKENERKRKEEKAKKEKEREERDRRKSKHRSDKERGHEREKEHIKKDEADTEIFDLTEDHFCNDNRRSVNDNNKKHRKRHNDSVDDLNESEKDRSKSSHRHSSDHKKSRRHASTPDSDGESRHKRHKRDHRNGSRRNGDHQDLEDGEFGDDGETW
ncbi:pre-mRNA-processing protein 40A-like isoform X2 [Hevea brasiliensis]|uniref:pre-mRNA-processing protein 40A-like isoform X2 n=1 Tax=Hevea brasiliensis TaxID=3981 RepID=UPI0025FD115A|nr:pre-mRNA-processing protein 40A-like isoform X2 [Hevea brasiliensis]